MKNLRKQLIKLLNIHGVSGQETAVHDYLKPILTGLMDTTITDAYGNLLAQKKVGNGEGATVLLSAHMDTVRNVYEDRKLIENNGIITSDKGVLGADDRAGIAIILTVLRNLNRLSFNGTIKVAFSREEEIGCVGSSQINKEWYSDVDLAIVVDRRGNRDIVVGCGMAFCSDAVGTFMENVAHLAGMPNWECVEGGISDAMTFAENGINSINISAGYMNEHTEREFVVIEDMRDTIQLVLQTIAVINDFYGTFGEVPHENSWVKAWYPKGGYSYTKLIEDDLYADWVYAETVDDSGDVFVYEVGAQVVIQQGNSEILLSRESLRSLVGQLKNV